MAGEYRTIFGAVQFDPQEADVNGKDVLRFTIRSTGTREQSQLVSCTLWPSHKDTFSKIEKGTVLMVQGKYSVNKSDDKTYHNLSVSDLLVLGVTDTGEEVERTGGGSDAPDDDESW